MNLPKRTPMMQQWDACKEAAKGAIVFFRLGDFFEAFEDDAKIISDILDLTLTQRNETPMCGMPWHAADGYIERLIAKGYSVSIADQMEPAEGNKGLVDRRIVRTITPGTAITSTSIDESANHFIALVNFDAGKWGLSLLDITTAELFACEESSETIIFHELCRARPKEILVPKPLLISLSHFFNECKKQFPFSLNTVDGWRLDYKSSHQFLKNHFKLHSLASLGLEGQHTALNAISALLSHIHEELLIPIDNVHTVQMLSARDALYIDRSTASNLELFTTKSSSKEAKSLFDVLNTAETPMGARLIRSWLEKPSLSASVIGERQDALSELQTALSDQNWAKDVEFHCKHIKDIQRLINRIATTQSNPKELFALALSCKHSGLLRPYFSQLKTPLLQNGYLEMADLSNIATTIFTALSDNPPLRIGDGTVFRAGYNSDLDELMSIKNNSENWLLAYQQRLRDEIGIKTLKVGFSKSFGYFIEVSRGQADKMPPDCIRRQTLVNGERFISQELKEYEEVALSAESRIKTLEESLFTQLKEEVLKVSAEIMTTGKQIALLDALVSLSRIALKRNYIRPQMHSGTGISIRNGRHPVAETYLSQIFVPNDLEIDSQTNSLILITGPNMGGKSTYIRQQALLVLMAQMGSFIPAVSASIGLVDKLFSRIGASDDLGSGQSTFMVEMAETALILNQATARSLIILDEIGRGTSTYDGIAIAKSVAEHLIHKKAKTLFATHYYELTDLEAQFPTVKNCAIAVYESKDEIKFLYKIIPGKADKSYGIHVAQLAGLPKSVLNRAKELLAQLEAGQTKVTPAQTEQPQKIDPHAYACLEFIEGCDLNNLSPLQCFSKLLEFKQMHNQAKNG